MSFFLSKQNVALLQFHHTVSANPNAKYSLGLFFLSFLFQPRSNVKSRNQIIRQQISQHWFTNRNSNFIWKSINSSKKQQQKKQSMVLWNWLFWCTSRNEGCYSIRYTSRKIFGIKTRLGHHLSHQKRFDLWRKKSMKACLNLNVKDAIFKGHCMCQQHLFFSFADYQSIHPSLICVCS